MAADYREALLTEREYCAKYDRPDRVKQIDAELKRIGADVPAAETALQTAPREQAVTRKRTR